MVKNKTISFVCKLWVCSSSFLLIKYIFWNMKKHERNMKQHATTTWYVWAFMLIAVLVLEWDNLGWIFVLEKISSHRKQWWERIIKSRFILGRFKSKCMIASVNYKIIQVQRDLRTSLVQSPAHIRVIYKIRSGYSNLYPTDSWKRHPFWPLELFWAICASAQSPSQSKCVLMMFRENVLCFSLCSGPAIGYQRKEPGPILFVSFRYLYTL